jgi:AcrR family transcriptional regulator
MATPDSPDGASTSGRLSKAERRRQLLETALAIVREEGADRLTLGHLAARAGVSKPIAYEHFGTRSGLLIELYRMIDRQQTAALREALTADPRGLDAIAGVLASAYMHCYADTSGEWHAIGAALSGSEEMGAIHQEMVDGSVQLFIAALEPHSDLPPALLHHRCTGLVGAGEALSASMVRGECSEAQAADALAALIRGGLAPAR